MIQDRNIHRDALALRQSVSVPLSVPLFGVDQDEPIYHSTPRFNWRVSDLSCWTSDMDGVNPLTISVSACPLGYAAGSPRVLPNAGLTSVLLDKYWASFILADALHFQFTQPAARFFTGPGIATVLDGFWGVWLWQNQRGGGGPHEAAFAAGPVMSFGTEEIALANCPKVRDLPGQADGRHSILTVRADGADFVAGTDNTDAAQVAEFNTAPQAGHVVTIPVATRPQSIQSILGQQLKDASGTNILQGKGGIEGDALVVMTKCFGGPPNPVLTGPAQALVEYRPWPAGGEGLGDVSVSQNRPSFVP